MPRPIPEWDMARRIVKYIGTKQVQHQRVTFQKLTHTVGIGRERVERILREKKISYRVVQRREKPTNADWIFLKEIPAHLAEDAGLRREAIVASHEASLAENEDFAEAVIVTQHIAKKELENTRIRQFWKRPTPLSPSESEKTEE